MSATSPTQRNGLTTAAAASAVRGGPLAESGLSVALLVKTKCEWPGCGCSYWERQHNCAPPLTDEELHGGKKNWIEPDRRNFLDAAAARIEM